MALDGTLIGFHENYTDGFHILEELYGSKPYGDEKPPQSPPCGSSGSKVPILPDSTTVHYPPYTTVCCIVIATYSLHVEVHPSF